MARLIISPIPHMQAVSLELDIDKGRIVDTKVGVISHRRLESLVRGYHVRDLPQFAQRVCAGSGIAHEIAAATAIEQFEDIMVTDYTRSIRNIMLALEVAAAGISSFYMTSLSGFFSLKRIIDYQGNDRALRDIRERVMTLERIQDTAPLHLMTDTDPFLIYDPDTVAMIWFDWYRSVDALRSIGKALALIGGRSPGGVANAPGGVLNILTQESINSLRQHLSDISDFIDSAYLEDVLGAAAGPLNKLHEQKIGYGVGNFISFGMYDIEQSGDNGIPVQRFIPAGVVFSSDLKDVRPMDLKKINEELKYSWYQEDSEGITDVLYSKSQAYSFVKAARYQGTPVEAGPLSRMVVSNDPDFAALLEVIGSWPSFLSRILARAFEVKQSVDKAIDWTDQLSLKTKVSYRQPAESGDGIGLGLVDGAHGAIMSEIKAKQGRIFEWNLVGGSTWNASPRDNSALKGPIEQALVGTPCRDDKDLINVYRVLNSFDICPGCAAH